MYKYVTQIVAIAIMSLGACVGLLLSGFMLRIVWEGFLLGFTGLGLWL